MEDLKEFKKRFESLRAIVGDYRPEVFEHLEKRFYELYLKEKRFRYFINNDLQEGKCPVREWVGAHSYPVNKDEKEFLQFFAELQEDSAKEFLTLMRRYLFKLKNSQAFKEQCKRQEKGGFNSIDLWMDKYNYTPVFKKA